MIKLGISIVAGASILMAGAAFAADPITIDTSATVALPLADTGSFDWSGFYAGVFGAAQFGDSAGEQFGLGVSAGVNAQFDFYLVGAEVSVQGLAGGDIGETSNGQILGRAGLVVADDLVVYAAGGYGIDLGPSDEQDVLIGAGLETAVTDSLSVEAQYIRSFPVEGGTEQNQFTLGANFHF